MLRTGILLAFIGAVAADSFPTICPVKCENGGTCMVPTNGNVVCLCARGFMGPHCEQAALSNPCESNPCQNGFTCSPVGRDDYHCGCPPSGGKNCEHARITRTVDCMDITCVDGEICIMETVFCKRDPCPPPAARCVDRNSDVCRLNPCQNGGVCKQQHGQAYTCTCPVGFIGRECEISTFG